MQPGSQSLDSATLEIVDKSLRLVKRHRKQRHAKLRDMAQDDGDTEGLSGFRGGRGRWAGGSQGTLCPVCLKMTPGDLDVVEAHIDSCLTHQARLQEERERAGREQLQREQYLGDVDVEGDVRILVTDGTSFTGLGFAVRDHSQQDIDDDIDVDGEDEAAYGAPQFSEGDVVNPLERSNEDEDVDIDDDEDVPLSASSGGNSGGDGQGKTLQDIVAKGDVIKKMKEVKKEMEEVMGVAEMEELDRAVDKARTSGDANALVEALEKKLSVLVSVMHRLYLKIR